MTERDHLCCLPNIRKFGRVIPTLADSAPTLEQCKFGLCQNGAITPAHLTCRPAAECCVAKQHGIICDFLV
jgi:hypothetical protein